MRKLRITEDRLTSAGSGSGGMHALFALFVLDVLDWSLTGASPALEQRYSGESWR